MFRIRMLFRMHCSVESIGGIGCVGSSGTTAFLLLHLNIVVFEFDVLGAVENAFGVVVRVG